jgi:hypothetical protein
MAKKEYHIPVQVITVEDVKNCLQDLGESGILDIPLAVNDKEYVKNIICMYFNSANQFRQIIGQPMWILPEKDEDENSNEDNE